MLTLDPVVDFVAVVEDRRIVEWLAVSGIVTVLASLHPRVSTGRFDRVL